ncbi:hypothetical protein L9F63_010817, partial [Diploptera punctata]
LFEHVQWAITDFLNGCMNKIVSPKKKNIENNLAFWGMQDHASFPIRHLSRLKLYNEVKRRVKNHIFRTF